MDINSKPSENTIEFPELTDRQMLVEIYKNSKRTKSYMMWQLIITIAFVIIPLLAALLVIPYAIKSLTSIYSTSGLTDGMTNSININAAQDLLKQYTK